MLSNLSPPPLSLSLREISAPIDWLNTLLSVPKFAHLPTGDGRPILLAPGYLADQWSMRPLRQFLRRLDYRAHDWGLGRNLGNVDEDIVKMGRETLLLAQKTGSPITLIGWSLGGVICREVARLFPEAVREVITLGTPVTGGPKYTAAAKRYASRNDIDVDELEQEVLARNQIGFEQPITVLFSKRDGIVSWRAALDVYNDHALHVEVDCTHLGIGVHPKSWEVIAHTLSGNAQAIHYTDLKALI